jgi:hypothetical protein
MTRNKYSLAARSLLAASVAVVATGVAGRAGAQIGPGTDSYRYFFSQPIDKAPSAWRQSHPNGMTEQAVLALASSDLSACAANVNPPVFSSAPADPTWRQTHPSGLTDQELMPLSSSSVSRWQNPDASGGSAQSNVAQSPRKTKGNSDQ